MELDIDAVWNLVLAAARVAERPQAIGEPDPVIVGRAGIGW